MTEQTDSSPEKTAAPAPQPKKKAAARRRSRRLVPKAAKPELADFLKSDAGKKAFQSAVAETTARLVAELAQKREDEGTEENPADRKLLRGLAAAIAEISDTNSKVKRIPAAELEARAEARTRMEGLILDALAREEVATYELTRQVFLDEQLINPTYVNAAHVRCVQAIDWAGVPDESMLPVNEAAKAVHEAYMRSIGGRTKDAKVSFKRASDNPKLRVHGAASHDREAPNVGTPRGDGGLRVHRPGMPGQVTEMRVLGTLSEPARQVA